MNPVDANRVPPKLVLKDELARLCLPAARRDPNRRLAWMNSICILFLLIGILGAKRASVLARPLPPVEEALTAVLVPIAPPPPESSSDTAPKEQTDSRQPDTPQVVVVVPDAPNISFSVPTIGNLLAPSALAQAPPITSLKAPAPLRAAPIVLHNTGAGGERPAPGYPRVLQDQGEQGSITVLLSSDADGKVSSLKLEHSSGFQLLDQFAMDFIRRRWTLPETNQLFEVTINYKLEE
jgi:protein TonB